MLFIFTHAQLLAHYQTLATIYGELTKRLNINDHNGVFAKARLYMMEQSKLNRLSSLFEKMVAESANIIEKRELKSLYNEFINDGREQPRSNTAYNQTSKVAINS